MLIESCSRRYVINLKDVAHDRTDDVAREVRSRYWKCFNRQEHAPKALWQAKKEHINVR